MKATFWTRWLLCGIALTGCADKPKVTEAPVSKAKPLTTETGTETTIRKTETSEATVGGYKFTVPAEWSEQPPKSEYTLGEYSVPGSDGPARLTISSARGGIEANIERWKGQFNRGPNDPEPRESTISFDGTSGTLVELSGGFTDMFDREPKRGWRMLGAAIPLEGTGFFIKMTGPASTVTDRRDEFIKFVESAHAQK